MVPRPEKCHKCMTCIFSYRGRKGRMREVKAGSKLRETVKTYCEMNGLQFEENAKYCDNCAGKIRYHVGKGSKDPIPLAHPIIEPMDAIENEDMQNKELSQTDNEVSVDVEHQIELNVQKLAAEEKQPQNESIEAFEISCCQKLQTLSDKLDFIWAHLGLDIQMNNSKTALKFEDVYSNIIHKVDNIKNNLIYQQEEYTPGIEAEVEYSQSQTQVKVKYTKKVQIDALKFHWRSVVNTESKCFVCNEKSNRAMVPKSAKLDLLIYERIYVPAKARCCSRHIDEEGKLNAEAKTEIKSFRVKELSPVLLTATEITEIIHRLLDYAVIRPGALTFTKSTPEETYKLFLGVSIPVFETLLSKVEPFLRNSKLRSTRDMLAVFLMKLSLRIPQRVIGHLVGIESQQVVSYNFNRITDLLEQEFLKYHLGFDHITREDAKEHNVGLASQLFEVLPENVNIVADGTYIDIQKPKDHRLQHLTYCYYKKKNLVKIMKLVFEDGYIWEADGIWGSDSGNSDAHIMKAILKLREDFRRFLRSGDNLILDRGFLNAKVALTSCGLKVQLPSFVNRGENQLQCSQANYSRAVTKVRWVVEANNGWIKNVFHFFDKKVPLPYLPKLGALYKIACAIKNIMAPPLSKSNDVNPDIAATYHQRLGQNNTLMDWILQNNLHKKRLCWKTAGAAEIDFPELTHHDLEQCTFGCYQINRADYYARQLFQLFLHKEQNDVVKIKSKSRMSKKLERTCWIRFDKTKRGAETVEGTYCTCMVGARTFGICCHITAALWFLGYKKNQPQIIHFSSLKSNLFDAACLLSKSFGQDDDSDAETVVDSEEEEFEVTLGEDTCVKFKAPMPACKLSFPNNTEFKRKSEKLKTPRMRQPLTDQSNLLNQRIVRNGIPNVENSCYINASMQLLCDVPEALGLLKAFVPASHYVSLIFSKKPQYSVAVAAKNAIIEVLPAFKSPLQQDAQEFLTNFLDLDFPSIQELRNLFLLVNVTELFCPCGEEIFKVDTHLGLYLLPSLPVQQQLESLYAVSTFCICGQQLLGRLDVVEMPSNLLLFFKIFGNEDARTFKRKGPDDLPLEVNVVTKSNKVLFTLSSLICHIGDNLNWGHYVAYSRKDNGYVIYDDSCSKAVKNISGDVYIALYKRQTVTIINEQYQV